MGYWKMGLSWTLEGAVALKSMPWLCPSPLSLFWLPGRCHELRVSSELAHINKTKRLWKKTSETISQINDFSPPFFLCVCVEVLSEQQASD